MKKLCVIIIYFCILSACTVSHENPPDAILFGDVVGNYIGTYKECTFINATNQDSICQSLIPETLRVSIADQQHIQIKSLSGHIPTLKLQLRNDTGNGADRKFGFQLIQENHLHSVLVRPSQGTLEYYSGNPVLNTGTSTVFSGMR